VAWPWYAVLNFLLCFHYLITFILRSWKRVKHPTKFSPSYFQPTLPLPLPLIPLHSPQTFLGTSRSSSEETSESGGPSPGCRFCFFRPSPWHSLQGADCACTRSDNRCFRRKGDLRYPAAWSSIPRSLAPGCVLLGWIQALIDDPDSP